jgi:membrane glycosyltransferase
VSAFILWPVFFWWLSPVLAGLVVSIPLSIFLGKVSVGQNARGSASSSRRRKRNRPTNCAACEQNLAECYKHLQPIEPLRDDYGLLQAVLDPYINAMHVALLRQRRPGRGGAGVLSCNSAQRLLRDGPDEADWRRRRWRCCSMPSR